MSSFKPRISVLRVAVLLLEVVAAGLGLRWFLSDGLQTPVVPETPTFAGYVDVTTTPAYAFETPADAPQSHVILSFIVAATDDPCTPTWGTYYTLDAANSEMNLERRIAQLREIRGPSSVACVRRQIG